MPQVNDTLRQFYDENEVHAYTIECRKRHSHGERFRYGTRMTVPQSKDIAPAVLQLLSEISEMNEA
jgi:hypothetical protein